MGRRSRKDTRDDTTQAVTGILILLPFLFLCYLVGFKAAVVLTIFVMSALILFTIWKDPKLRLSRLSQHRLLLDTWLGRSPPDHIRQRILAMIEKNKVETQQVRAQLGLDDDFGEADPQLINRITQAIQNGEVLKIRYHGGSQPGAVREIIPKEFDGIYITAICVRTKRSKTFFPSKMEILPYNEKIPVNYEPGKYASHHKRAS